MMSRLFVVLFFCVSKSYFIPSRNRKYSYTLFSLNNEELMKYPKKALITIIEGRERELLGKDKLLEGKDKLLEEKDKVIEEKVTALNVLLKMANSRYLKLKGNLSCRGIIETLEQSDEYRKARNDLVRGARDKTPTQEQDGIILPTVTPPPPTRQQIWDKVFENGDWIKLGDCIKASDPLRTESLGKRMSLLYNKVSSGIHKPDDDEEVVIIRRSKLFDHEVSIMKCVCEFVNVRHEVQDEYILN
mmetsp:Transcript_21024/g.28913  ORF Transcript_21024/g.28913 Transcript_21024/m.28913 type:complete len:245 (+) Transcript_21024:45-779(+)